MQEFSSVTASSYDADALAPLLTEKAADGWEVVSIVAAGTNIVAYLTREGDGGGQSSDVAEGSYAGGPGVFVGGGTEESTEEHDAGEVTEEHDAEPADEPAAEPEPEPEPVAADDDSMAALAAQVAASDEAQAAMPGDTAPYVPVAEEPAAEPEPEPAVVAPESEPAGWAVAPEPEPEPAADTAATQAEQAAQAAADAQAAAAASQAAQTVAEPAAETAAAEPAAAESTVPAGWYADPSRRYELRYWDGTSWTEHVSRAGQQYTDPPVA